MLGHNGGRPLNGALPNGQPGGMVGLPALPSAVGMDAGHPGLPNQAGGSEVTTYVYRDGELIDKDYALPLVEIHAESSLGRPYIASDNMEPTRHMADGCVFTSKAKFRANTRAHGCTEVGDQKGFGTKRKFVPKMDKRQRREDVARAIGELKAKK